MIDEPVRGGFPAPADSATGRSRSVRPADHHRSVHVHIASRVQVAVAEPGEVLLSGTVHDLVTGSGLPFADRGRHALKGVQGEWQIYALADSSRS